MIPATLIVDLLEARRDALIAARPSLALSRILSQALSTTTIGGARIEWNDGTVEFFADHNAATWHAEDFGRVIDSGLIVTEDGGELGRVVECLSAEWERLVAVGTDTRSAAVIEATRRDGVA